MDGCVNTGLCEVMVDSGVEGSAWPKGWLRKEPRIELSAEPTDMCDLCDGGSGQSREESVRASAGMSGTLRG